MAEFILKLLRKIEALIILKQNRTGLKTVASQNAVFSPVPPASQLRLNGLVKNARASGKPPDDV